MQNGVESTGKYLRSALFERIHNNPQYSLRAFARDLRISHSFLSQVINGRKRLSVRQAHQISEALSLTSDERERVIRIVADSQLQENHSPNTKDNKASQPDLILEIDVFRCVNDWYHGAILELTQVKGFKPSHRWISKRLGITESEVRIAITRLKRLSLLKTSRIKWERTHPFVQFPVVRPERAIQNYHSQMIDKARKLLDSQSKNEYSKRDITAITAAINPDRLEKARKKITAFRKSITEYLSRGECREVYQLNIQLFPLTREENGK